MATADIAASQLTNISASILSQDMEIPLERDDQAAQLLDILPAFLQAAQLPAHTCADVSLHLRKNNRLAVLRTHHEAIVNRLLRITSITLQNTSPPVHSYLAAPNNSCRGVIHGIASGATPDEIINDQADILHARRMGTTGSAIITFIGTHVPYTVYYRRLEFRCRPHKPRAHHCNSCVEYRHRTLACPGNQRRCPTCSTTLARPDEPHPCTPLVCVASTRSMVLKQGTLSRISTWTFTHSTRRIPQQF
ncbi:hypothetical protein HPB47_028298 [Ixodes persulcatus]|uniref:Uncharacterized protein n=1 Tax=Ixodes persulcatus TaxID=34615 RepID=A0AC60PV44_IXOPE|nr:hypothetical protein HPB47_028298 [Ixodes persulcatus]